MRRTLLSFAILFFLFALASPLRFAYAAAPQTDPTTATTVLSVTILPAPPSAPSEPNPDTRSALTVARSAIDSVVQSLTPPLLSSSPPPIPHIPSVFTNVLGAPFASAVSAAARDATNGTFSAAQSAGTTLLHALSQAASAWSTWVALANARLIAKSLKRTEGATRQKAFSLGVSLNSRS